VQSKNITSSIIIGLIDGIRSPLILAATMSFLHVAQQNFQWIFTVYLLMSAIILSIGHWFTIRSENKSATGEALQKEKEIYQNIGLTIEEYPTEHRKPEFMHHSLASALRVGLFYLLGGTLVFIPFLLVVPIEKALLISLSICLPVLAVCGFAKARFYKISAGQEIIRTAALPVIAIGLLYVIIKLL
jgi:VIT1/CCC1 family predicted Fe2+/Mn2+ transporter